MKTPTLFFILTIFSFNVQAQEHSALYQKVDSLITHQLHYTFNSDSSTVQKPEIQTSETDTKGIKEHFTINNNPAPIIFIDGQLLKLAQLDHYVYDEIEKIEVYEKGDIKSMAIFGTSGKNGAILITTKKAESKKNTP